MTIKVDNASLKTAVLSPSDRLNDTIAELRNRARNDANSTAAFTCIFQTEIEVSQQNTQAIDIALRTLVDCADLEGNDDLTISRKRVLIALLKCSKEVSFNFENKVHDITLKSYLKDFIDKIISGEHDLESTDYEVLCAIAEINPLLAEEVAEHIVARILYVKRRNETEVTCFDNLIKTLWTATVRLRRQQKFIPKLLMHLSPTDSNKLMKLQNISQFKLSHCFLEQYEEDLKSRTTDSQVLEIFSTLNYHLRSCIDQFAALGSTAQVCSLIITVTELLASTCQNMRVLANSININRQEKCFHCFADLRELLGIFVDKLCNSTEIDKSIFDAVSNIINVWCGVYSLSLISTQGQLDFPVSKSQMKVLKKKFKSYDSMNQLRRLKLTFESSNDILLKLNTNSDIWDTTVENDHISLKLNTISDIWSTIVENYHIFYDTVEKLSESDNIKIASLVVNDVILSEENFTKWTIILKENKSSKKFATALALQTISNMLENLDSCTAKQIIEEHDVVELMTFEGSHTENILQNLKKKIKEEVDTLHHEDFLRVEKSLKLLLQLPLSFMDANVLEVLFLIIYNLERHCDQNQRVINSWENIYSGLLQLNDINIIEHVPDLAKFLTDFVERQLIVSKMFKTSIISHTAFEQWKTFFNSEFYNQKLYFIFLSCLENLRGKQFFKEHKTAIQELMIILANKIRLNLDVTYVPEDLNRLAICLKINADTESTIDKPLRKYLKTTIKTIIQDTKMREGSMQLAFVVLKYKEYFRIKSSLRKQLCTVAMDQLCEKSFLEFLEVVDVNEFKYFTNSFIEKTKKALFTGDEESLKKLFIIWENFSKAEASTDRSKFFTRHIVNILFAILHNSEILERALVYTVKLFRILANAKRMVLFNSKMVDAMFTITLRCLNKVEKDSMLELCGEVLEFLSTLLNHQNCFVIDRLVIIVDIFKKTVRIVLRLSKESNDSKCEQELKCLAHKIEKLTMAMTKLKRDFTRISPFLIADMVHFYSQSGVLPTYMKVSMEPVMVLLLSVCEEHSIKFLRRSLQPANLPIFKRAFEHYSKYDKYKGGV